VIPMDFAPRLRPDVFVVPSGRGTAYVRSSTGTDLIAAPGIAAWLDRLTPFLDGTRTVGQLLEGLDDTRRPVVLGVLERLDAHGLLQDRADRGPALRADAYARLRVLVLAPAPCGPALTDALRLTGVARATQVTDRAEAEAAAAGGGYDALLLLTAHAEASEVAGLDRHCRRHGMWFAPAVGGADAWWIGPMLGPGRDRPEGGWLGAWLRLADHASGGGSSTFAPEGAEGAEVAAALLTHRFQQAFTGAERSDADQLVRLDPAALTTSRHPWQPHFSALGAAPESEAQFRAKMTALRDGPVIGPEEFSRRAAGCIDARTGLLAELDEGGLPQFPRSASMAVVRDPVAAGTEHRVYGVGPDFATARVRAARRALEVYGRLAADPRRYLPTPDGPAVWAWSPEHGTARLVPAAAVYGRGRLGTRGVGSGATFDQAVAAARLSLRGGAGARTALVVPLDHDPAATRVLPYLLKAVNCVD